jgi:type I restriction enzyme, R subunit
VTRELSDQQRADLKRRLARYSEIAQGDQTISAIAYDIPEHFTKFWKGTPWKAQFAVRSRAAAVKYYKICKEMGTISAEVIMSAPDDRSTGEDPAEEVTEPVARFWKTMMTKYGGEEEYNRQITEGFKKREEPELLIVVSKLLTGFDALVNTVLYIDKTDRVLVDCSCLLGISGELLQIMAPDVVGDALRHVAAGRTRLAPVNSTIGSRDHHLILKRGE